MVKAVLAITAAALVPFTLVFAVLFSLGVLSRTDLAAICLMLFAVVACVGISRTRAWRLGGWLLTFLFLCLPTLLTLSKGGWTPASVYFSLGVALGITLLGPRSEWVIVPVSLAAYAAASVAHGGLPGRDLVALVVSVAAPLCGIAILMWFSSSRMEEALGQSRAVAAGLRKEVAERKRIEAALREAMERNRALFESIPDGIAVVLLDGAIVDCNGAAVTLLDGRGRGDLLGRSAFDLIAAEEVPAAREGLRRLTEAGRGGRSLFRQRLRSLTGRQFDAQLSGDVLRSDTGGLVGVVITARDITEALQMEGRLRQAQKMEAVGQLAGGVAHDFNNLLLGIQGYTELALQTMGEAEPAREHLDEVLKAAERAGALIQQLLAFSRREALQVSVVNPNDLIEGLLTMVKRLIGEHVSLRLDLGRGIQSISADPSQIEQALVNLCINARDAMPDGGTIDIGTEDAVLDEDFARLHPGASPGRYVLIHVSDNGIGMSPHTLEHLFEPFFTTKTPGRGPGIGLATVYHIVTQHKGFIHCESRQGRGARFSLYLPAVEPKAAIPSPPPPPRGDSEGGTETLLIAEDDEMVRGLATRILSRAGYKILCARDGDEALRVFDEHAGEISLALVDVVMPGMNGRTLAHALRRRSPHLPILFSSGYDFHLLEEAREDEEKMTIVRKPYHPQDLLRFVREAIDGAEGGSSPGAAGVDGRTVDP